MMERRSGKLALTNSKRLPRLGQLVPENGSLGPLYKILAMGANGGGGLLIKTPETIVPRFIFGLLTLSLFNRVGFLLAPSLLNIPKQVCSVYPSGTSCEAASVLEIMI